MSDTAWLLLGFAGIHLVAVASPGPSFLMTVRTAASRGRGAGLWLALGLSIGTVIWAALALFGLALMFQAFPALFVGLKLAGALFLLWIAFAMWRHADTPLDMTSASGAPAHRALRTGLLVQLTNPKATVFFGSVLLGLVPVDAADWVYAAILVIVFVNEMGFAVLIVLAFGHGRVRAAYLAAKRWIDRCCGALLALLGLRILTIA